MTGRVPDALDYAEVHFGLDAARRERAAREGTCGTCCRFERNDVDPDNPIGLCVGSWGHRKPCRKCGTASYAVELYWEWTDAENPARGCDGYEPCGGYAALR